MIQSAVITLMQAALLEGKKAVSKCGSNPPVGCVISKDNRIVARGHTNEPGKDHAEAMALRTLPDCLIDYSVFVTLEPCSFHGKTPSCAKALADHGVGHVYVAMIDPDPRNSGKGIELIRSQGIEVTVGVLQAQALSDLMPYLVKDRKE